MTVFNLGSINTDYFYKVAQLPAPGETLAASNLRTGLGGKGTNQSVAAAHAGSRVFHIGAVGPDGDWAVDRLSSYGVDVSFVARVDAPTRHAIINVDEAGENAIVIYSGANLAQRADRIEAALEHAVAGDTLLLQNETSLQPDAAKLAHDRGMKVIYSAAPFSVQAVREVLPFVTTLVVNQVEADQLTAAFGIGLEALAVAEVLVTLGAEGARWHSNAEKKQASIGGIKVTAVDTTGAGDTFAGYFAACRDQGMDAAGALEIATAAAALKITRHGTADAIPSRAEVDQLIARQGGR